MCSPTTITSRTTTTLHSTEDAAASSSSSLTSVGALLGKSAALASDATRNALEERVKTVVLETMKNICADSNRRISEFSRDIKLLNEGLFYENDYFVALKSIGETKRFNFFLEKGTLELFRNSCDFKVVNGSYKIEP